MKLPTMKCPFCDVVSQINVYTVSGYSGLGDTAVDSILDCITGKLPACREQKSPFARHQFGHMSVRENDDIFTHGGPPLPSVHVDNLYLISHTCCERASAWVGAQRFWPTSQGLPDAAPNEAMPPEIKEDYLEAASVFHNSPRSAAALLRLCVQKLLKHLGEKGENIHNDITTRVQQKSLSPELARAYHTLRITGNNAAHPGQLDLQEDPGKVRIMFDLLNFVVEHEIRIPQMVAKSFDAMPESLKEHLKSQTDMPGPGTVPAPEQSNQDNSAS